MKKLLFESSVLQAYKNTDDTRSGIFFVGQDLLKQFTANKDYQITLFTEYEDYKLICQYRNDFYPECEVKTEYMSPFEKLITDKIIYQKSKQLNNILLKVIRKLKVKFYSFIKHLLYKINYTKKLNDFNSYDIFFSPYKKAPEYIINNEKISRYLIIHDFISLLIPDYLFEKKHWFNIAWNGINKNDYYFCISNNTKKDLLENFSFVPESHTCVSYNGIPEKSLNKDLSNETSVLEKYNLTGKKYIFNLGSNTPHKNLKNQIISFVEMIKKNNITDLYFVIAGPESNIKNRLQNFDFSEQYSKYIKTIGYIEDNEVNAIYKNALFFSFISSFEGFGLPPLEAMIMGCPVVSSNTTSLPEICEDAALLVSPENIEEQSDAYAKLYYDTNLRNELTEKGYKQIEKFSWDKTYRIMRDFINTTSK